MNSPNAFTCEIVEARPTPTVSLHARTSLEGLPTLIGTALARVAQYLADHGESPDGPPFVAYRNQDMKDLDVEIGFPVAHAVSGSGPIDSGVIPGGRHAVCVYVGPYSGIGPAYEALGTWIGRHGYRPGGSAYEFYLNDPATTPSEELQTRIMVPVISAVYGGA